MKHLPEVVKIESLKDAKVYMEKIGVMDEGIDFMSPKALFIPILLHNIDIRGANIIKQEMLAAGGDAAISKDAILLSREFSDVLLLGTLRQYDHLLKKMRMQPFGLAPAAAEIESILLKLRENRKMKKMKCGDFLLDFEKPLIMGILNVTPDSFSDGGRFFKKEAALKRAKKMIKEGADIIDIGGESSRPGSLPVSQDEEERRTVPIIRELKEIEIPISVDTCKGEVAEKALAAGASMVNDITALSDEKMVDVVKENDVPIILMHKKGEPADMQKDPVYDDVIFEIKEFLSGRIEYAENCGLSKDKIIIDPGIGFGKTTKHNLEILKNLKRFESLGKPVLVGASRKNFIGETLNLPLSDRLEGSLAVAVYALMNGANILRVHDVMETKRVARMVSAFGEKPMC